MRLCFRIKWVNSNGKAAVTEFSAELPLYASYEILADLSKTNIALCDGVRADFFADTLEGILNSK